MSTRTAVVAVLLVMSGIRPAAARDRSRERSLPDRPVATAPIESGARERDIASDTAADLDRAPAAPPPDSLVTRALARSPSLAALRSRVERARALVPTAGALPNPMLEVMVQDAGFPRWTVGKEEMSMIGPQLTQTIPFPGKRGALERAAQADVSVASEELEAARREVAREVRATYARLYALDQERRALEAGRELLDMLAATVRRRYAVGEGEQEAAVKAQLEVTRIAAQLDDNAAERAAAVATLDGLLDLPGDAPLGRVDSLPAVHPPAPPWADAVIAGSAEVAKARAQVTAAERRLDSGRRALWPDLEIGAGAGFRGALDPVATFRLGLELPLWAAQSQLPMIRAASRELDAARADLRDAEASARAEAARLEAEWRRSGAQVPRYAEGVVPQTNLAFDAARSGYLAGRVDFSTVIEDFRMWFEARAELARREAERYTTWAGLEAATGGSGASPANAGEGR